MKWLCSALFVFWLLAVPVAADKPTHQELGTSITPGVVQPTPEMWFYEQYRADYQNPEMAVRQKAEFRAMQRQNRVTARQWFGLSNSRPRAASDPYHGEYSPRWTSNNGHYTNRWTAWGPRTTIVTR